MKKKFIGLLIILLFAGSTFQIAARSGHHSNYDISNGIDLGDYDYKDGVYQGSANAFGPDLTVEIEIEKGKLISVEVIDHNEIGRNFWYKPLNLIPGAIVEAQSTDVDTVAGATASSEGLLSAVENALEKARI